MCGCQWSCGSGDFFLVKTQCVGQFFCQRETICGLRLSTTNSNRNRGLGSQNWCRKSALWNQLLIGRNLWETVVWARRVDALYPLLLVACCLSLSPGDRCWGSGISILFTPFSLLNINWSRDECPACHTFQENVLTSLSGVILHTLPPWLPGCFIRNGVASRSEDWTDSAAKIPTSWVKVFTSKPVPWTSGDIRPVLTYSTSKVTVNYKFINTLRHTSPWLLL